MALDATPKSATANSYLTVEEADAYLGSERLHTEDWDSLDGDSKARALIWASKLLDAACEYKGAPRTFTQAMRWPRIGTRNRDLGWYDQDEIPQELKEAAAELALALVRRDRSEESELAGLGLERLRVGPVDLTIDKSALSPQLVPQHVIMLIDHIASLKASVSKGGFASIRLERA